MTSRKKKVAVKVAPVEEAPVEVALVAEPLRIVAKPLREFELTPEPAFELTPEPVFESEPEVRYFWHIVDPSGHKIYAATRNDEPSDEVAKSVLLRAVATRGTINVCKMTVSDVEGNVLHTWKG